MLDYRARMADAGATTISSTNDDDEQPFEMMA